MLQTQQKFESNNVSSKATRYLVQGMPVAEGCKVLFTRQEQVTNNVGSRDYSARDFDFEFELFKRLEPQRAAALDSEAQKRSNAAANQG